MVGRSVSAGIGSTVNHRVPFHRFGNLHVFFLVFFHGLNDGSRVVFHDISRLNRLAAVVYNGRLGDFYFSAADSGHVIGRGNGGLLAVCRGKFRNPYRSLRLSGVLIGSRVCNRIGGRAKILRIERLRFFVIIYRSARRRRDGNFYVVVLDSLDHGVRDLVIRPAYRGSGLRNLDGDLQGRFVPLLAARRSHSNCRKRENRAYDT